MVKVALQVPVKANLRDHLSTHDLIKVKFAETMASEKIERDQVHGNARCQKSCQLAGDAVATALNIMRSTPV